jgi:hypothetical protein
MQYVELVAVIALIQFFFFGALTGRARTKSGLTAPAMTGHEGFERMYRGADEYVGIAHRFFTRAISCREVLATALGSRLGRDLYSRAASLLARLRDRPIKARAGIHVVNVPHDVPTALGSFGHWFVT